MEFGMIGQSFPMKYAATIGMTMPAKVVASPFTASEMTSPFAHHVTPAAIPIPTYAVI